MKKPNKVYIIAEAGVNHNGSIDNALKMISQAKTAGADCIKFQAFKMENLLSPSTKTASYQKKQTGKDLQWNLLKELTLNKKEFKILANECKSKEIDFLCTAFDIDWLKYLISLGMKHIKVPSGEITNYPYLKFISKTKIPIILSTGMSTINEIKKAVELLKSYNKVTKINVLHCTSLYPAPNDSLNLLAIGVIKKKLKLEVGYSDHSVGNLASIAAVSMGASIIEKHFTLNKNMSGPDHIASANYKELKELIEEIRNLEMAMGNGIKKPHFKELETLKIARRSWHAFKNIKKGNLIKLEDIILIRPGLGIPGNKSIEGRKTKVDIKKGDLIKNQWLKNEKI